jgi:predicted RNA-binding protein YlqC (UPF0109 family)
VRQEKEVEEIKRFVNLCVLAVVDCPDQVEIRVTQGEQTTVFDLFCAKEDIGKVIGQKGRNIMSMRTLMNALAVKLKVRCVLELND